MSNRPSVKVYPQGEHLAFYDPASTGEVIGVVVTGNQVSHYLKPPMDLSKPRALQPARVSSNFKTPHGTWEMTPCTRPVPVREFVMLAQKLRDPNAHIADILEENGHGIDVLSPPPEEVVNAVSSQFLHRKGESPTAPDNNANDGNGGNRWRIGPPSLPGGRGT